MVPRLFCLMFRHLVASTDHFSHSRRFIRCGIRGRGNIVAYRWTNKTRSSVRYVGPPDWRN